MLPNQSVLPTLGCPRKTYKFLAENPPPKQISIKSYPDEKVLDLGCL